jgi:hypothetical protein
VVRPSSCSEPVERELTDRYFIKAGYVARNRPRYVDESGRGDMVSQLLQRPWDVPPTLPEPRQRRSGGRSAKFVPLVVAWLLFSTYVFWQALEWSPLWWFDSADYRHVAGHPLLSAGFWTGQRPPLVPLLWKITGSPTGFVALQTVISVLAWGFLALTVARMHSRPLKANVSGIVVLFFAASGPVILWDRSVLTETTALSLVALFVALTILCRTRLTWARVISLAFVAALMAANRDSDTTTVALIAFAIVIILIAKGLRLRAWRRYLVVLCLALFAIVSIAETAEFASHRNVVNVENVFSSRIFLYPSRASWFVQRGMPELAEVLSLRRTSARSGEAPFVVVPYKEPKFRKLRQWFAHSAEGLYLEWLVTHPNYVLSAPFKTPLESTYDPLSGNLLAYGKHPIALSVIGDVFFPSWEEELVLAIAALGFLTFQRMWKEPEVFTIAGLGLVGILTMFIAWHGDGEEVARHMLEGNVLLRLSIIVLFLAGIFGSSNSVPGWEINGSSTTDPRRLDRGY